MNGASTSTNGWRGAKNTPDSFKDDPWGKEAQSFYYPHASALTAEKWDDIFACAEVIIKKKGLAMVVQLKQATGGVSGDKGTKLLSADDIELLD